MALFKSAKGDTLDRIADMYWMRRKVICSIPLLRGWKLVKQESDDDFKKRIMEQVAKFKRKGGTRV